MVISQAQSHQELHWALKAKYSQRSTTNPAAKRAHGRDQGKDTQIKIQRELRKHGNITDWFQSQQY